MSDPYDADTRHLIKPHPDMLRGDTPPSDTPGVAVSAGWALLGKQPGTDRDYSVLNSSDEPLSGPEFASVMRHFMPGTPPTERERPDSLPWVTISRVRVEEQVYLGIAIMDRDPAGQVDVARRPITRTSYFCVRYVESLDDRISYYGLYEQVARQPLPYASNDTIPLSVPCLDPESAAHEIRNELKEPAVRAAAARLLVGPVSILGAEKASLDQRLRFLDAVASLLPYGYRTSFSAATWSDSGARHPIRLAFASRPRQDASVVKWASSDQGPVTGSGEQYARLLAHVLDRPDDEQLPVTPDPLTALIRHLADDTAPRGFDQPQEACARVRDFGLPFIVWDEVRAGDAGHADIRAVFRQHRVTELPWAGRRALLLRLFFSGEPDDWELIRPWLVAAIGDNPADLLAILVEVCYPQIWTSEPSMATKIGEYLGLAFEYHLLDNLLAALAETPASRADLMGGLRASAQAIADGLARSSDLAACPHTWAALAKNPLITCELLAHLAGSGSGPAGIGSWLMSIDSELLIPFSIVFSRSAGDVRRSGIERLAEFDEECVRALLDTASCRGRLDRVLPAFAAWLGRSAMTAGGRHHGATRDWCQFAADLDRRTVASQAWLDLVMLICGRPRFLREQRDLRSWKRYNELFAEAWKALADYLGPAFDEVLTETLANYLEIADREAAVAQFAGIEDLIDLLTAGDQRRGLRISLEEIRPPAGRRRRAQHGREQGEETHEQVVLSREQARHHWESTQQWDAPQPERSPRPEAASWPRPPERDEHPRPGASYSEILDTLGQLQPGARIADITGPCLEALAKRVDPRAASRALAESSAIASGALGAQTIRRLRNQLGTSPEMNAPGAGEWLYSFAACFADEGVFGPQFAQEFTEANAGHIADDIDLNLRWLLAVPPDQRQLILRDLADRIEELSQSLPSEDGDPAGSAPHKRTLRDRITGKSPEKKVKSQEGKTE